MFTAGTVRVLTHGQMICFSAIGFKGNLSLLHILCFCSGLQQKEVICSEELLKELAGQMLDRAAKLLVSLFVVLET